MVLAVLIIGACTGRAESACNGAIQTRSAIGDAPASVAGLHIPHPFRVEIIARVPRARELAPLPNGDLLVGTGEDRVFIVPRAESAAAAGAPAVFATFDDAPAAGVAFVRASCTVYVGTQTKIYAMDYRDGALSATNVRHIGSIRPGGGDDHNTTSLAFTNGTLYASIGSSCNVCAETDPTRATIQQMSPNGSNMRPKAVHIRNAIAMTVNPDTGTLWAGDAGQDTLPWGHPYEFFDGVTRHAGVADYGWPDCEENHNPFNSGANCSHQIVPAIEFPAYSTIVGAAFYPKRQTGAYAFPQRFRGGAFLGIHGSWHTLRGVYVAPPRVAFVPMNGDEPQTPVNWANPGVQWSEFLGGFQHPDGGRAGRPTGIAIGSQGSLFIADDAAGVIYRVRPE